MQLFVKLFGPYLQWVYHCFDRIVINGHLLGLMRENQVIYFFGTVWRTWLRLDGPSERPQLSVVSHK